MTQERYALVTPAKNEEVFISSTIEAVLSQTILPQKWIIVSDGSTDRTDQIVAAYAQRHRFIELVRTETLGRPERDFGSKVRAFQAGYSELLHTPHEFIGNLDADVTFAPDYFERILRRFQTNPRLGLAGGIICELGDGGLVPQRISSNSVAGAVQLFRRETYEAIGGYIPLKRGGIDAAAEIMTRMHGWQVQTFPDIPVRHPRRVSTGGATTLNTKFRQGVTNYQLGYHPAFQLVSCLSRSIDRPYLVGSICTLLGYGWALVRTYERVIPNHVIKYLRSEQTARIVSSFTPSKASQNH